MADKDIRSESASPTEEAVSTYSILDFQADKLPKEYKALVYSRWLRSFRHGNEYFKMVDSKEYYDRYQRFINDLMYYRTTSFVRLAVLSDDHDVVLGFAVHRNGILDYVHVHKDQRGQGIATNLVPGYIASVSHMTKTGAQIWKQKKLNWVFNPFA